MRRVGVSLGFVLAACFLLPAQAFAQASISGIVQDASGAVLPGVTVEATSPALIEKARTAVTDGAGRYSIVDLRPGTYEVTFSLPGFSTVKREGIVLSGNFDAPVNAEMKVGSLEETITVSGASPVVDVKNTLTQTVLTKEQIEVLPGDRTVQGARGDGPRRDGAERQHGRHRARVGVDRQPHDDGRLQVGQHLVGRGTGQLGVGSVTQTQEATIEELVYDAAATGRGVRVQRRAHEHDSEGRQQPDEVRRRSPTAAARPSSGTTSATCRTRRTTSSTRRRSSSSTSTR